MKINEKAKIIDSILILYLDSITIINNNNNDQGFWGKFLVFIQIYKHKTRFFLFKYFYSD